jgi:hypothetical protein
MDLIDMRLKVALLRKALSTSVKEALVRLLTSVSTKVVKEIVPLLVDLALAFREVTSPEDSHLVCLNIFELEDCEVSCLRKNQIFFLELNS